MAALFAPAANLAAAVVAGQSLTLAWNLSTNTDVTNYNVYYGVTSGVYTNEIAVGATNMATVTGLVGGTTYFFVVTAEDAEGLESAFSNETNAMAPFSDTPPDITSQPASQAAVMGGQVTFSVTASGAPPLTYQWSFDGTNLAGATNASLTISNVQANQAGSYTVWVGNTYGSNLSSAAVLTLATLPSITMQPASQSVETGCSATFNVQATGTIPLSYQWLYNGVALPSQTKASLFMTGLEVSQFGNYSVVVNNPFGAVTSAVAVLALASPPTVEPVFVERYPQGGVRFHVSALLSNATVAKYDTLTLTEVSSNSAAGGTVTLSGPWIYYTPPTGAAAVDTFSFTVSDGHCGTTEGRVTVSPTETSPQPSQFSISKMGNGSFQLSFGGVPNETYQLQCTEDLSSKDWQILSTQTTDEYGLFQFTDWPATNVLARFYRAVARPTIQPIIPVVTNQTIADAQ